MKLFKQLGLFAIITISFYSCSDDLSDLNVDPNSATSVDPSALLSRAQYVLYDRVHGRNLNLEWGMLMVQYWTQNEYTEESRYDVDENTFNSSWETIYTEVLNELKVAKELISVETGSEAVKTNKLNIIDVMMVQAYLILTDGFGDIPYTDSLDSSKTLPSYDSQESIYKDLLVRLKSAATSFDTNAGSFSSGDLIYGGDVTHWKKLTHSLMLRAAMRISDVDSALAKEYVITAATDLISSNAQQALFVFDSAIERSNPMYRNVVEDSRDDFCVTEYLVNELTITGDPRLDMFARVDDKVPTIIGMPYGLSDEAASNLKATRSRPSDDVRSATSPHVIISHAEVKFLLAEAYERGYLSGSAEAAFNAGVNSSMEYWGVESSAAATYLAANPYDSADWKTSIAWEKWVNFYTNGYEAWSEFRRLDSPSLAVPALAEVASVPTRLTYPQSEVSNNSAQLEKVTTTPGEITTKLWWDVN